MIYLISPYTGIKDAHKMAGNFTGHMMKFRGLNIFSPIVYAHRFAKEFRLPGSFDYWKVFNLEWIEKCDEAYVLMIPGWKESKGCTYEIVEFKKQGKKITYFNLLYEVER